MRPQYLLAAGVATGALTLVPAVAHATVGAGVGANPITLAHPATPGHTYRLPSLYVVNTGTEPSRYLIRVQQLSPGAGRDVPASWVHIDRNGFRLASHQHTSVPLRVSVPAGAAHGVYVSDLVASTAPPAGSSGAVMGAAAATKLTFRVGDGGNWLLSLPWQVWGGLGGLGLLGALEGIRRRTGLRLHVSASRQPSSRRAGKASSR